MPHITELLVHPVRIPRKFFSNARGKTTHIEAAIVQIHSDPGGSGLGEAAPLFPNPDVLFEEIVSSIRRFLAPCLVGNLRIELTISSRRTSGFGKSGSASPSPETPES